MKKELISEAVSNIKEEYITEAQTPPTANRPWQRKLVAAVVALCLLAGGLWALSPSGAMNVTAYAVDSNQPITANGVVLDTKALTVTLQDSGQFFAKFVDYKITDADTFVRRPDAKVVPRAELYAQGDAA